MNVSLLNNFIAGEWQPILSDDRFQVVNPSSGKPSDMLGLSSAVDVDRAVDAARRSFPSFSQLSKVERLDMFDALIVAYEAQMPVMAEAISTEMGAPITMSRERQAAVGLWLLQSMRDTLADFAFEAQEGATLIRRQPIGVAGMITPWNWPMNQVVCKVSAALAAGCPMVLKPSEYAPYSAAIFADIMQQAGVPSGVFNLVQGGQVAGAALAAHPQVDMISITGSVRAGVAVAQAAAPTVKRVSQELGGKSPFVILPSADLAEASKSCVARLLVNTGQSCNAPTRLFVHETQLEACLAEIKSAMASYRIGDPMHEEVQIGPLVNQSQFERVNSYIQSGINAGATLLCGGVSDPQQQGFFVQPTVFYNVAPDMAIYREEIFGPVLCVVAYNDEAEVVELANDSPFGLSAYVFADTPENALPVADQLHAGMVHLNNAIPAMDAPFGGYKQSGNGRERGRFGLEEYLEIKSIFTGK